MARRGARHWAWLAVVVLALYGLHYLADALGATAQAVPGRLRVALFINGTLGDKSFFDAAAHGLDTARSTLMVSGRVVEGGTDPTRWQAALADLADSGEYDVIVTGTFTMVPYVERLATAFPAMRFIVYDASVDHARCRCANVHSMLFRQNEGAYLAGYLGALLAQQGLPGVPPGAGLGAVGGMQFPVIEDFLTGFTAGARAAVPDIALQRQFANAFSDPAAGKQIAQAQFGRGAALIFHAAGATGQGVNEAAQEAGRYAIGVDLDQYEMYRATQPARAAVIVTSVLKDVDRALVRALERHLQGTLRYGVAESLGLAEGAIRLAGRSAVLDAAPPALLADVARVRADIIAGRIKVPSAFAPLDGGGR